MSALRRTLAGQPADGPPATGASGAGRAIQQRGRPSPGRGSAGLDRRAFLRLAGLAPLAPLAPLAIAPAAAAEAAALAAAQAAHPLLFSPPPMVFVFDPDPLAWRQLTIDDDLLLRRSSAALAPGGGAGGDAASPPAGRLGPRAGPLFPPAGPLFPPASLQPDAGPCTEILRHAGSLAERGNRCGELQLAAEPRRSNGELELAAPVGPAGARNAP